MKPRIFRIVSHPLLPMGSYRSSPAEVGTGIPQLPVVPSQPMEHPQVLFTTLEVGFPPMEPVNGSILATTGHPALPVDPAVPARPLGS